MTPTKTKGAVVLLASHVQAVPQFFDCSVDDQQIGCSKKRAVVERSPEPNPQFFDCSVDDQQIGCSKKRAVVERSPEPGPNPQFLDCSVDDGQIGC